MSIKCHCRTNDDIGKQQIWPQSFLNIPRPYDKIQAKSGFKMKVVQITYGIDWDTNVPFIELELSR